MHGIFFQGNKRKQIPTDRLGQFFEAVSVLMSSQLRELSLNSIADYLEMFCPTPGRSAVGLFPGFVVNVTVDGTVLQFEPSQKDLEVHAHSHCALLHTNNYVHSPLPPESCTFYSRPI